MQTHLQGTYCMYADTCSGHLLYMQAHLQGTSCICKHIFKALTVYANTSSGHFLYMQTHLQGTYCICKHIFRALPVYANTSSGHSILQLQALTTPGTSALCSVRDKPSFEIENKVSVLYTVVCGYFIYFVCKTDYSGHALPLSSTCCLCVCVCVCVYFFLNAKLINLFHTKEMTLN